MTDHEPHREPLKRRLRSVAPVAAVAFAVLAAVVVAWLLLRPDPEELQEIVTVDAAGDTIVYSGPVRDAIARARIVEAFNSVAAPPEDSLEELPEADSARQAGSTARLARQAAVDALARLYAEPADPGAVVAALNLAIIDFQAGEAVLPGDAAGFIQAAAEVMERAPVGVTFLVAGHASGGTDAAEDLALSQRRADEVARALAAAGADPDRLRAEGYGSAPPGSADGVPGLEATEPPENRHIVFRAVETDAEEGEGEETDQDAASVDDLDGREDPQGAEGEAQPEPGSEPGPGSEEAADPAENDSD